MKIFLGKNLQLARIKRISNISEDLRLKRRKYKILIFQIVKDWIEINFYILPNKAVEFKSKRYYDLTRECSKASNTLFLPGKSTSNIT